MPVLLVLLGLIALILGAGVALFTLGTVAAVAVAVVLVGAVGYGLYAGGGAAKGALALAGVAVVAAGALGGLSAFQVYGALSDTSGEADPADATALASAERKLDDIGSQAGFRIELTDAELTAVLQDALAQSEDNPIRRVDLEVIDGPDGDDGVLAFEVTFKNGSLTGSGRVGATLDAGLIALDIQDVSLGRLSLPGVASGAMADIVETVLDVNERLAESRGDVQSVRIGQGRVLVTGTQGGGEVLTGSALLGALAANAAQIADTATAPVEQIGPGTVDATSADGPSYVVALGDSLAANVGVPSAREGYVSRFHSVLAGRDGILYGLRNFGVSGETSGTLIRSGQMDAALAFIEANEVAYVTVNIGANDLLGHLGSDDCSQDIADAACQARLEPALATYRANLDRILGRLRDAAGEGVPILLLTTYNPFSLGLGSAVALEVSSDEATEALNSAAVEVAAAHGVTVADGFASMRGRAAAATHMLDTPPDIHPRSSGYDLLAQALQAALP